jgi:hypothetical protein
MSMMRWSFLACWPRRVAQALGLALALLTISAVLLLPRSAMAGYYQWDTVTLPLPTGAACGNGTPYRFFVNRAWRAKDTVIVFEGGGACWDQAGCEGRGPYRASNPDGVPDDYLQSANTPAYGLITPFSTRLNAFETVRTQSWNLVYLPYCTGDVHTGNRVQTYADADSTRPRVQHHRGHANAQAVAQWLRASLPQARHLLITGFSAGGVGATAHYPALRDALAPTGRAALLADSGPLFPAPLGADPAVYPSAPLHARIRSTWGLDDADGLLRRFEGWAAYDPRNLGSIPSAIAVRYPQDRFGYASFIADGTFPGFSYGSFDPAIPAAPDEPTRQALLLARWEQDLLNWQRVLAEHANVSYFLPYYRRFANSHCLTLVDFTGTGIEEVGAWDMKPFVYTLLDHGAPMRLAETDRINDLLRPLGNGQQRLEWLAGLFR